VAKILSSLTFKFSLSFLLIINLSGNFNVDINQIFCKLVGAFTNYMSKLKLDKM